jgi:hypothetical protein
MAMSARRLRDKAHSYCGPNFEANKPDNLQKLYL